MTNETELSITALEQELNSIETRAQSAKSIAESGGAAGPYDEAYIQTALDAFDLNRTDAFDVLDSHTLAAYANYLFVTLEHKGNIATYTLGTGSRGSFITIPDGAGIYYGDMPDGGFDLHFPPQASDYIVIVYNRSLPRNIEQVRLVNSNNSTLLESITSTSELTCAVIKVKTDGTIEYLTTSTSNKGKALPFFTDAISEYELTNRPLVGSHTKSVVIGDTRLPSNRKRNELYGTISNDSSSFDPDNNAAFENGTHFTFISDISTSADREQGLIVGAQFNTNLTISPEYDLMAETSCDKSDRIISHIKDEKEYIITGGSQLGTPNPVTEVTQLNVFEYTSDNELVLTDSFKSFGTGDMVVINRNGSLRIVEFQHRKGTARDAPVRVFDLDTTLGTISLVSTSTVIFGSVGVEHFTYKGIDYFFSWPSVSTVPSALYQLDASGILFKMDLPSEVESLRNIVVAGYNESGLPFIYGVNNANGSIRKFQSVLDATQVISFGSVPAEIIDINTPGVQPDFDPKNLQIIPGSDGQRLLLATPLCRFDDKPETQTSTLALGVTSSFIGDIPALEGYSVIRSFIAEGYTYLACMTREETSSIDILRHISDGTFETLLTIETGKACDLCYSYSNFKHLLTVATDDGDKLEAFEFRTNKAMLSWSRTSFI